MDIQSTSNERVKQWAKLHQKKERDRQGLFMIEGFRLVEEALHSGAGVASVVFTSESIPPAEWRTMNATAKAAEWISVSDPVMAKCTDTRTPQGIFAVVHKPDRDTTNVTNDALTPELVIACDGVSDPGNLGTIIRNADAAGATGVVLGRDCADLYNPKTVRATMGSLFHLPVVQHDLPNSVRAAKQRGTLVVGTRLDAPHVHYAVDYRQPTWIVLGNEADGMADELAALADMNVNIPIPGRAESLNVAMASAVLLYEAVRQRHYANFTFF